MSQLAQDVRFSLRMLAKNPGFTAIAVLSIGLGIFANTTVFSVLNAVRFRPLPFPDPERLVQLLEANPVQGGERNPTFGTYQMWKTQSRSFEGMGMAGAESDQTYYGPDGAEQIHCEGFDLDLQSVLNINPILGRRISKEDQVGLYSKTALISYDFWQQRLGGAKDIIGKKMAMEDGVFIGVLPRGFWLFPWGKNVQLWSSFDLSRMPSSRFMNKIGRLKPGVTIRQAEAELATISQRSTDTQTDFNKGWVPRLVPLREAFLGEFQQDTYFLLGAVGFVLLIACANVANLLLARGYGRRKEFAIRASVGGGRRQLFQQVLTESVLISLAGGLIGLALTVWGIKAYVRLAPGWFPLTEEVGIDGRVLAFTSAISVLSGLLFGLMPALHVSRVDLAQMLNESGQTAGLAARRWTRSLLLAVETALAVALLAGASLMIGSYMKAVNVDLGFDPRHILTMYFRLAGKDYYYDAEAGSVRVTRKPETFYRELLERTRALPGVESAGISSSVQDSWYERRFRIVGRVSEKPENRPRAAFSEVDSGFFATLNIRLLQGRLLDDSDTDASPWVVVVNETLARRFFPHENPIGQSLQLTMDKDARGAGVDEDHPRVIVGVVKDEQYQGTEKAMPVVYTSYRQHLWLYPLGNYDSHPYKYLFVRTSMAPASVLRGVRTVIADIDPRQAPYDPVTMDKFLAESLAYPRFIMQLISFFAGFAVVLAAVGVYGTTFYLVGQRRHEMALRAALGARRADLIWLVVKGTATFAIAGAALGCLLILALSKILTRFLYGVESVDPKILLAGALLMTAVATLASYLPVRRAAKVDPMAVLRHE